MGALLLLAALAQAPAAPSGPEPVAAVVLPAGRLAPVYGLEPGQRDLPVAAFRLDVRPVSRAAWAAFTAARPRWRRGAPPRALADERYLASLEAASARAPVVDVSWFAASAYCAWRGGRLPTTLEWEYAAAADETRPDAARTPEFARRILDWYARPTRPGDLEGPGSPRTLHGVEALHGLVWEWTQDFNASFATGDARRDGDLGKAFVCGAGATGSARREDYAAFMRYALRASLSARSCLPTLGFRCAYPLDGASP